MVIIRNILEKNCDDKLKVCKEFCSSLTTTNDPDKVLFNDRELEKIKQCATFGQLFDLLRKHWSWKEYSILKTIIAICESIEANDELNKFEKIMGSCYGMILISEEYSSDELPANYVKLCVTIDKPYKSLTLQDFDELHTFIFEHLNVKKYIALPFIKFLFSSIHLEWYVPIQAVSHIIKMAHLNKKHFIQKSIVLIKVGDKSILDVRSESFLSEDKVCI